MKKYQIIAISEAPIIDLIYEKISPNFVDINQDKEWQVVDQKALLAVQKELEKLGKTPVLEAGGQLGNTLYNLQIIAQRNQTTIRAALLSSMATDELGAFYKQGLEAVQIDTTLINHVEGISGKCLSVTIESDTPSKVMLTCLSKFKSISYISVAQLKELCTQTEVLLFEGYLFNSEAKRVQQYIEIAHQIKQQQQLDLKIGMTLSAEFIAKGIAVNFVKKHVDLIATNDTELACLTGIENPYDAISFLDESKNKTIVCTLGKKGALIASNGHIKKIAPQTIASSKIVDVTGAGDAFFAGFLYGFFMEKSIEEAGAIAQNIASEVIQKAGARLEQ